MSRTVDELFADLDDALTRMAALDAAMRSDPEMDLGDFDNQVDRAIAAHAALTAQGDVIACIRSCLKREGM